VIMLRTTIVAFFLFGMVASVTVGQRAAAQPARLSAAQIIERHATARGGADRWRAVQTLSWSGKLQAGGVDPRVRGVPGLTKQAKEILGAHRDPAAQVELPFRWDMMRGRKSRLEVDFNGDTAVQVFDGQHGWKVRPFLNRRDVESYTADELKSTEAQTDVDGALIDYQAKGTQVELVGTEKVAGRDAYKLKLTFKNNAVVHDWVDAESFLEVKIEGTPRKLDGKPHAVEVYLSDYRTVNNLVIPHVIETKVEGVERTEKIQIEKVVLNPRLDADRFSKPVS